MFPRDRLDRVRPRRAPQIASVAPRTASQHRVARNARKVGKQLDERGGLDAVGALSGVNVQVVEDALKDLDDAIAVKKKVPLEGGVVNEVHTDLGEETSDAAVNAKSAFNDLKEANDKMQDAEADDLPYYAYTDRELGAGGIQIHSLA